MCIQISIQHALEFELPSFELLFARCSKGVCVLSALLLLLLGWYMRRFPMRNDARLAFALKHEKEGRLFLSFFKKERRKILTVRNMRMQKRDLFICWVPSLLFLSIQKMYCYKGHKVNFLKRRCNSWNTALHSYLSWQKESFLRVEI